MVPGPVASNQQLLHQLHNRLYATAPGFAAIDGNWAAGNGGTGIYATEAAVGAVVTGNMVGLDRSGLAAQPNANNGIQVAGDDAIVADNIAGGNGRNGVLTEGARAVVRGNWAGLNRRGAGRAQPDARP